MSNVYVVMGTFGEYSDRREWAVAAFMSEEAAKARVLAASQAAREAHARATLDDALDIDPYDLTDEERKALNPHDPAMGKAIMVSCSLLSSYEASYFYYTVPLIEGRNEP